MNKINFREEERHGTPYFPFQAFSQKDTCGQYFAPYHWHDEVEFLYVTEGSLLLHTETDTHPLKAGHVYFINPGTVHGIFGDSPISHHYALLFPLEFLSFARYDICQNEFLSPVLSGKLQFPLGDKLPASCTSALGQYMEKAALASWDTDSLSGPLSVKIALLQILETLFSYEAFLAKSPAAYEQEDFVRYSLKPVFSYIEVHYMEKITLEQLSLLLHMNKNYFCKFFKEKVGKTPFSYLNEYRINQAAALLLKSSLPVTEIALNTGFENISYFIRQFKHYRGCTPSAFRSMKTPKAMPIL